jgi:hypothetical protein
VRRPRADLGSIRVSRVGLKAWPSLRERCSSVAPKQSFFQHRHLRYREVLGKVGDGENAIASTRDACAPRT